MVAKPFRVPSETDPKTTIILNEGDDYLLEEGAPVLTERSSCFLMATAERILLGHRPEHLNGHGEHTNGPG